MKTRLGASSGVEANLSSTLFGKAFFPTVK